MSLSIWHSMVLYPNLKEDEQMQCPNDKHNFIQDLFRNFGAAGFCISNRFLCHFFNGKGFECLSPRCDGFNTLVEVVKSIIGMKPEPVCGEALCDNWETGWLCAKCGAANKFNYRFCGNCGMVIGEVM